MIYYRLMSEVQGYKRGTLFSFEQKHKLMSSVPWEVSRTILWEKIEMYH